MPFTAVFTCQQDGGREEGKAGRRGGKEEEGGREGRKEAAFGSSLGARAADSHRGRLAMSSATSTASLPSGLAVLTTFPDVLFIPEIVSAGFSLREGGCCWWGHPALLVLQVLEG